MRWALAALLLTVSAFGATVPRQSPEFVLKGPGGQLLLSQFKGKKPVLLFFFFTTCPHCQNSTVKVLNPIQEEYRDRLQILGVAFNEMADMLLVGFFQQYLPKFPIGGAPRASVLDYLQHPANQPLSVPIYVFIDKQGVIRAQHLGGDPFFQNEDKNTRQMVETLLKGMPQPATKKSSAKKK